MSLVYLKKRKGTFNPFRSVVVLQKSKLIMINVGIKKKINVGKSSLTYMIDSKTNDMPVSWHIINNDRQMILLIPCFSWFCSEMFIRLYNCYWQY